jgi:predicted DNA-binding transcriptional regulator AlpA
MLGCLIAIRKAQKGGGRMAKGTKREGAEPLDPRSKGFLNVREAQQFAGIRETSLYRLVKGGKLKKYKILNRTVFSRVELEAVAREEAA